MNKRKKYIEQFVYIDEIVNYQGKLGFIINDSPFISGDEKHFSDIGYIGKYKITAVMDIYNSKFHISDSDYYKFDELNITEKEIKIKIDVKNRIKLNNSILFAKNFVNLAKSKWPLIKVDYFLGNEDSYILLNNNNFFSKEDIIDFIGNDLLNSVNFYFNITSILNIEDKTFIYFKLFDNLFIKVKGNIKEPVLKESYGIFTQYNFFQIMDYWYYDISSNTDFVYLILDKYNYYILFNISDKDKLKQMDFDTIKNKKILSGSEFPCINFYMKKYNNFEEGLKYYLKYLSTIIQ